SKLVKAKEAGVRVLTEDEWFVLVGERRGISDMAGRHENDHDQQDQPKSAARPVTPSPAVAPGRQGAAQCKYQDNYENGREHGCGLVRMRKCDQITIGAPVSSLGRLCLAACRWAPRH